MTSMLFKKGVMLGHVANNHLSLMHDKNKVGCQSVQKLCWERQRGLYALSWVRGMSRAGFCCGSGRLYNYNPWMPKAPQQITHCLRSFFFFLFFPTDAQTSLKTSFNALPQWVRVWCTLRMLLYTQKCWKTAEDMTACVLTVALEGVTNYFSARMLRSSNKIGSAWQKWLCVLHRWIGRVKRVPSEA